MIDAVILSCPVGEFRAWVAAVGLKATFSDGKETLDTFCAEFRTDDIFPGVKATVSRGLGSCLRAPG